MPSRKSVVLGLDPSGAGRAALEQAAELADLRRLPLRLVRAYAPSRNAASVAAQATDEAVRKGPQRLVDLTLERLALLRPTIDVSARLVAASAAETLVEESKDAGVVVIGSRRGGGRSDLVIGSTTLHVASRACCPVIAVPEPPLSERPRRGIVVGVDGRRGDDHAVEFAFRMASDLAEPLLALHAWTKPAADRTGRRSSIVPDPALNAEEEQLVMAEAIAGWAEKFPDVEMAHRVVRDHPVPALLRAAAPARFLVVGSRDHGPVGSLLLGAVSHGVLLHATGPVVIAHAED